MYKIYKKDRKVPGLFCLKRVVSAQEYQTAPKGSFLLMNLIWEMLEPGFNEFRVEQWHSDNQVSVVMELKMSA